jgi:GH24 family phage-related lysozyme (muramidase)
MNRRPIFDKIRKLLGRGFTPAEVKSIDAVIDEALRDAPVIPAPTPAPRGMKTGPDGIALMKRFEGLARVRADGMIEAYPDPGTGGEPWTIGWGSTGQDPFNGGRIRRGTIWTRAQCDQRFEQHLAQFEHAVNEAITTPTTQNQFDAMVSLTYNIGPPAFARSTLLRLHNKRQFSEAAAQFLRFKFAGGRVMQGLVNRRRAEAELYARAA